jgi:hypothetical protein
MGDLRQDSNERVAFHGDPTSADHRDATACAAVQPTRRAEGDQFSDMP